MVGHTFARLAAHIANASTAANERCGSWYIDPTNVCCVKLYLCYTPSKTIIDQHKVHSVYFKSMDGHMGRWDFNLRRSNLHLLDVIREHGGFVHVTICEEEKKVSNNDILLQMYYR